tara:strand:- start:11 stop:244 length:234 start_codon:yes stop_codon:yes gene_type:complete
MMPSYSGYMFPYDQVISPKSTRYADNKLLSSAKYLPNLKKVKMKNDWMEHINNQNTDIQTKLQMIKDYLKVFPANEE